MSVQCKVCGQEFPKLITWKHLWYAHQMKVASYHQKYPDAKLVSDEYHKMQASAISKTWENKSTRWNRINGKNEAFLKPEVRIKLKKTEDQKKAIGLKSKEVWADQVYHDSMVNKLREAHGTPEARVRNSVALTKYYDENPQAKQLVSEQSKARWGNPTERAKLEVALRQGKAKPEFHQKQSRSSLARWQDPGFRAQMQIRNKKLSELTSQRWASGDLTLERIHGRYQQTIYVKKDGTDWVYCLSSYELMACQILDSDKEVRYFESGGRSIRIAYEFEGKWHMYLPDFLVTYKDGSKVLIEVKPQALLDNSQVVAKAKAGQAFCRLHSIQFKFWTEKDLEAA